MNSGQEARHDYWPTERFGNGGEGPKIDEDAY
jgi:hypothetical protein